MGHILEKHDLFNVAMHLLVAHPWNNILHVQVDRLFGQTLSGDNQSLKDTLLATTQDTLLLAIQA